MASVKMGVQRLLHCGQVGFQQFSIPVITYGSGSPGEPKVGITCCVHGDETSGLYIAARVIEQLKLSDSLKGTVHIIPAANSAALLYNERVFPLDYKDLNRVGRGNKDGSFTERTAAVLFEFLSQLDLVVNIHGFEMRSPVTAIFVNAESREIAKKNLAAISAFSPEMIWVIDASVGEDAKCLTTLDTALAEVGVVNLPIETSQLEFLSDAEINRAAQGILNVIAFLGIIDPLPASNFPTPAFIKHEFTAPNAGLWEPDVSLMQPIEAGMKIGTLTVLPDFEERTIYAPSSGVLIQYRLRQLVATGTSLFSIGDSAEQLITQIKA